MNWNVLVALVGGLGVGSLLTSFSGYFLEKRKLLQTRMYQEKREAYLGLLDSLHKAAVAPSDENSKEYALWQTRISLFGSNEVISAAQGMVDTNDGPREDRHRVFELLTAEMRRDLAR